MTTTYQNDPARIKSPQLYRLSYQPHSAFVTECGPGVSPVYTVLIARRSYHGTPQVATPSNGRRGVEPPTRGFSIPSHTAGSVDGNKDLAPLWDVDGRYPTPEGTPNEEAEELSRDTADPATANRPGIARAAHGASGIRVEVDGRIIAHTDIAEGEPLDHVEARLRLAAGQRGGLR